jgi:hypothetical protein
MPRADRAQGHGSCCVIGMQYEWLRLNVRTDGRGVDEAVQARIRGLLERGLAKHASFVERVTVRFSDVNGPRGGVDTVCSVKVVLRSLPTVVAEDRAVDRATAFAGAVRKCTTAVKRTIERSGRSAARGKRGASIRRSIASSAPQQDSLIGRREGRGPLNLERALDRPEKRRRDYPVDTSLPGVSATDRRAGASSTARRNSKRNTAGMTATLEDSAQNRPSRKSTRRSANRIKSAGPLTQRQIQRTRSAKSRATRASVSS